MRSQLQPRNPALRLAIGGHAGSTHHATIIRAHLDSVGTKLDTCVQHWPAT